MPDPDDLEPIALPDDPATDPVADASPAPREPVVRDRFLVALAVVTAIAIIALGIQLRAIARDTSHDADCSEALVAIVSSPTRASAAARRDLQERLTACLGPDATLPGSGTPS